MQLQYLSLQIATIIVLTIGAILLFNKKGSSATILSILAIIITFWTTSYLLYELWQTPLSLQALIAINYLCLAVAATTQFYFSLSYTNRIHWMDNRTRLINRFAIGLFFLEPAITQLLFWVEPLRRIFFSGGNGIWEQFNTIYIFSILTGSIILLIDTFARKPRIHFFRAGTIVMGAILPFIGRLLTVLGVDLDVDINLSIYSYLLAIAGFSYGIFSSRLIEITPITRDVVIEGMDDGWMVVDKYNKVIDMNSSAEEMIGLSREKIYGQPVDQILIDWPNVLKSSDGNKEMEMRRSVKTQKDWRYLNIRITQLTDPSSANFGHLILWRDITKRKLADDAHQRARDELFVLLNAISSAASRSMDLAEFLSQAGYQIVYSFHSQAVAVFLIEEKDGNQQGLVLKSQFGFSPDYIKNIDDDATASTLYEWLMHNEEHRPLVIDNLQNSTDAPLNMKNLGFNCFVIIPLIIYTQRENTMIGCLYLARNVYSAYSLDEVTRLTTISNQITTLIDSDRRAQAGMEAGSEIAPLQVLTRIGENARQAVKEMRLFLHEMQPVDLKDGLVSSLHHRLAAVEGRADIKARLLADENIQLTKDKEIALYYIAQEALNNILRHAHAKTVAINLKQTRQNVILKIVDDGRGFDIKKIDQGGMGLRNIKERALQVNGKFKITSTPGAGTKISVTVSRKS
jgi:PAS domain S-box-containing protein